MLLSILTYLDKDRLVRPIFCQGYHGSLWSLHLEVQTERHGQWFKDEIVAVLARSGFSDESTHYKHKQK